jgi:hypothetical protein
MPPEQLSMPQLPYPYGPPPQSQLQAGWPGGYGGPQTNVPQQVDGQAPQQLDAQIAEALGIGNTRDQQAELIKHMLSQADALRSTRMPQGYSHGDVFVASPLESLSAGVQRAMGAKGQRDAMGQEQDALEKSRKAVGTIANQQYQQFPFMYGG